MMRTIGSSAYLRPTTRSFWSWSEDGAVLTWSDGTTIAFRQEVEAVLERLAPRGLPPFGAIVLLLGTCRDQWHRAAWRSFAALAVHLEMREQLRSLVETFDGVTEIRPELRATLAAKLALAEMVFEDASGRGSPDEAATILAALGDFDLAIDPRVSSIDEARFELLRALRALGGGLQRVDEERLLLRIRTGLDAPPAPPDEPDLAPSERVRALLDRLSDDKELAGLARLARELMAAAHVPRAVSSREELPLGGVSDIANRGRLDQLLVSELAQDDLTLAVRIAMNEALYLRREAPPRSPRGLRAILIDAGVRMWGVPRFFASAVALALAAVASPSTELVVRRPTDAGDLDDVDLGSREGLLEHLSALEGAPHPGAALEAFLAETAARAPDGGTTEAILITHPDAVADPELQATLRGLPDQHRLLIATVDRDGRYRLVARTARGTKAVSEATLSLDQLAPAGPRPSAPLATPRDDAGAPAILALEPFPLLLPHSVGIARSFHHPRLGAVGVTRDGRFLHWEGPRQGARELTARVPAGRLAAIGVSEDATGWALVRDHTDGRLHLIVADLSSGRCTQAVLDAEVARPRHAVLRSGHVLLIGDSVIEAHGLATGRRAGQLRLEALTRWVGGRFLRSGETWLTVDHRGGTPTLTEVPGPGGVAYLFDRVDEPVPWAVGDSGDVFPTIGGEQPVFQLHRVSADLRLVEVRRTSCDGNRLLLRLRDKKEATESSYVIDIARKQARLVWRDNVPDLEPALFDLTRGPNVRRKIKAVGVDALGRLTLMTTKGFTLHLHYDPHGPGIAPVTFEARAPNEFTTWYGQSFEEVAPAPGARVSLRCARWPNGSCAWIDGRGLLHCRSADASIPELSIVLTDEPTAIWSSAGQVTGSSYFVGEATTSPPDEVWRHVESFVGGLR